MLYACLIDRKETTSHTARGKTVIAQIDLWPFRFTALGSIDLGLFSLQAGGRLLEQRWLMYLREASILDHFRPGQGGIIEERCFALMTHALPKVLS